MLCLCGHKMNAACKAFGFNFLANAVSGNSFNFFNF